jgi:hypothetical protein
MLSNKRPLAVLPIRMLRKIAEYILYVRSIIANIGNNPLIFVSPIPHLADVTTHVDDLEAAEGVASTGVKGSAALRDKKYEIVQDDLHEMLSYVQTLADKAEDETTAISIINASGFSLKNRGVRVKPDLVVENGRISGSVKLTAKAVASRASYQWQSSADGSTWNDLPPTLQAKTKMEGLTPGQRILFRYRGITKEGPLSWSNSVSWIVQ